MRTAQAHAPPPEPGTSPACRPRGADVLAQGQDSLTHRALTSAHPSLRLIPSRPFQLAPTSTPCRPGPLASGPSAPPPYPCGQPCSILHFLGHIRLPELLLHHGDGCQGSAPRSGAGSEKRGSPLLRGALPGPADTTRQPPGHRKASHVAASASATLRPSVKRGCREHRCFQFYTHCHLVAPP